MSIDVVELRSWIGRKETRHDCVSEVPIAALSATLDRDDPPPQAGDMLPPLWHWLYFLPVHRQSELGADGHAKRGGFLPPIPLPRRMWAGGRLQFLADLRVGEPIYRTSEIADVTLKEGRSGTMLFVLVRHSIGGPDGLAITEEHDIVYREAPQQIDPVPAGRPPPGISVWQRDMVPDPVLLFRYSSLTFNGHRIHYDRSYVTAEEGYPGLIVHGPLIATLLVDLVRRHTTQRMTAFQFRAVRPLFDTLPFSVHAAAAVANGQVVLWAQGSDGFLAMEAKATLAE